MIDFFFFLRKPTSFGPQKNSRSYQITHCKEQSHTPLFYKCWAKFIPSLTPLMPMEGAALSTQSVPRSQVRPRKKKTPQKLRV